MPSLQEAKAKADQIKSEKSDEIENAKQKAAELIATKAEQSLKSSVGFDEESQKKLGEIISVVGPLIEPYKTAFKDFFKS